MIRQLLLGGGISVINIAIHALMMTILVRVAQWAGARSEFALYDTFNRRDDSDGVSFDDHARA